MNDKGRKKIIVTFMLPMLLLYVVFQLYPIILNVFYSLLNWNGITKTANFIGFSNYREVVLECNPKQSVVCSDRNSFTGDNLVFPCISGRI